MITRILVPMDFSAPSDAALEYAKVLADKFGASLHVLHVVEGQFGTGPIGSDLFLAESPDVVARLHDNARTRLEHRVTEDERTRYRATTEIVSGTSARRIVDYATEREMDLIVMGTHGRTGMAHLLVGSVAEKVVRNAPCPVMTVRPAPAAEDDVPERLEAVWEPARH